MTITIDDTYLLWGSISVAQATLNARLMYKMALNNKEEFSDNIRLLILLSLFSLIPVLGFVILLCALYFTYKDPVVAILKYIRNIPKNARLLQTTLHENKQLKQDNAIFQKMLQSGLDYDTAKSIVTSDCKNNPNVDFVEAMTTLRNTIETYKQNYGE